MVNISIAKSVPLSVVSAVESLQWAGLPANSAAGSIWRWNSELASKVGSLSGRDVPFGKRHQSGRAAPVIHVPPSGAVPANPVATRESARSDPIRSAAA